MTHAADVTWRRALQATRPQRSRFVRGRTPVLRLLGPGLAEHDGEAVLTAQADPRSDPLLVLRMAARAARAGLPLSPSSVDRLVADSPAAAASPGRRTPAHLFVELLGAGPPLVPVWEALDQAGLLARLLPEWDLVRHRPQRNAVHRFSVDRHLLEAAVQRVARWSARCTGRTCCSSPRCCTTSARAQPGDHSEAGAPLAVAAAHADGLRRRRRRTIGLLVRHHLLLVETRDPARPGRPGDRRVRGRRAGHHRGARAAGGPDPWPTRWPPGRPPGASGRQASWRTSYDGPRCACTAPRRRRRRR